MGDDKVENKEKKDEKEKAGVEGKVEKEAESKVVEELSEKPSSTEAKESVATETKDSEATESKESEATEEESMDEGEDDSETTEDDKPETEEKKEGEDEDPSILQLAWEMLELAKVVYTKQIETVEGDKTLLEERLCSSILALGEVSLENENYGQAVEDIKLCLEKQKNLPKDSRLVAESHYQLGVAQGFNVQY